MPTIIVVGQPTHTSRLRPEPSRNGERKTMTPPEPAPPSNARSRPPRRQIPRCPRPNCDGNLVTHRYGDYVAITCIACGQDTTDQYMPSDLTYEVRTPTAEQAGGPRPSMRFAVNESKLTKHLEKYCDLRRRGYTHGAIRKRTGWPEYYPPQLFAEAARRGMKGTNENPDEAFREWLLEMHDAGMDIAEICRLSAHPDFKTQRELEEAQEAAHDAELERWTTLRENHAEANADWP